MARSYIPSSSAQKAISETIEAARANSCPRCGGSVVRNYALTGWVQCAQLGAPGFRKDSERAPCSWQGFTR